MNTSSCKAKGRRLQQAVRDKLREKYVGRLTARRPEAFEESGRLKDEYRNSVAFVEKFTLKDGDIESRQMAGAGTDIVLSPAAEGMIPFDIECKNTETAQPWAWMKQAKANTKPGRIPLVCFTRNREGDIYVMMRLDDVLKLLR
jgi:hypothetical protein